MNLSTDHRRALALLAEASRGVPEIVLVDGYGFAVDTVAALIRAGYARADVEAVRAGGKRIEGDKRIEVVRVTITDAGRRAMAN